MSNEDGTVWVIHNGEIYNYIEIAEELKSKGHHFKTRSDTEVILHAYEEWGAKCLDRFNGMWAFAVWDDRAKVLFCSKDRIGKKPFYYFHDGKYFIFASEIKALLLHPIVKKTPDDQTIYNYLHTGYGYADISRDTFFKDVKRLEGGQYIKIEDGKLSIKRYWDIEPKGHEKSKGVRELTNDFYELFEDAIKLRLRSDVSVGVALSGGLDSSAIACTVKRVTDRKIKTFSSCFDDQEFDERAFIEPVLRSTGFEHNFVFSDTNNILDTLQKIIWHQDEPSISLGIYVHWNVFDAAQKSGVKVVLVGQGGDETLAGYHKYYTYFFADLARKGKIPTLLKELDYYSKFHGYSRSKAMLAAFHILMSSLVPRWFKDVTMPFHQRHAGYLDPDFSRKYKRNVFTVSKFNEILNNDLYNAFKISPLPYLLRVDDKNGMAHSIESRSPFLDYRLVEFFFSIPSTLKIRDGYTKYLLRESMKGVLPEENRLRKDKKGFPVPARVWFRTRLKDDIARIFNSDSFKNRGYFNTKKVNKMFNDHVEGRGDFTSNIWSLLNLELWFRIFGDGAYEYKR